MDLNLLSLFLRVAQSDNFTLAADMLGVKRSSVSRGIATLEKQVGVQLFSRNTRRVALTTAGEAFYREVEPHLQALQNSIQFAGDRKQGLSGVLRISVPNDLAIIFLPPVIAGFHQRYPGITFEVRVENRRANLIEEGIDIALRVSKAPLNDSSLLGFELSKVEFQVYASPAYLARVGTPRTSEEASELQWLRFRNIQHPELPKPARECIVKGDDVFFLYEAARAGLGLAALPTFIGQPAVVDGSLTRVLPDVVIMGPIYMLHPPAKRLPMKVRVFYEYMVEYLKINPLTPPQERRTP
jgi:DNA-binding transcriptional LysR family regulator